MYIKIAKFNFFPYINLAVVLFFCIFVLLYHRASMKTSKDRYRLLNFSYKVVHVIVPNEQYDELAGRIDALNQCSNLTCGVFRFVAYKKFLRNTSSLHPIIAEHIGDNNLFVRLRGGVNQYFRYGYDYVDLTADADVVEATIAEFIKAICKDILGLIDIKIAKLAESPQENEEKLVLSQKAKDKYTSYYNQAGAEKGVYKRVLSGTNSQNVQIYLKQVPIIYYNKPTMRYGVEISVNDTKVLLYIGDKTQSILYMAALVRFKMGQPLYLHELYRNSHGLRSVYKREKTYKWFARIFNDLFGRTSSFEKWANPIRDNQPTPRIGHDFNQAKSAIEAKLEALFGENLALAVDICCLHIDSDDKGDTYYTFKCNPEDIILDETAKKWSIFFKKLYSQRY